MKEERLRAVWSFFALFLLLTSYYLVKPLRSSYFLKEFDPATLPYFFLVFPFLSLTVTRVFDFFYRRIPRLRLIVYTYTVVIACKIGFFFVLPVGGKWITLLFYLWASAYFLLCIAVLWACISSIFDSKAGERQFAFIAFGGMAGAYIGSQFSSWLADSTWSGHALTLSAVFMSGVLVFLFLALKSADTLRAKVIAKKPEKSHVFKDFKAIVKRPYIRGLAVIVFAVAFMNTVVEFKTQKIIDRQLAESQYLDHFSKLNTALCQEDACQVHKKAFEQIYTLKKEAKNQREQLLNERLSALLTPTQRQVFLPDAFAKYMAYRQTLEKSTRRFFSDLNKWINLIGVFLLLILARPLFKWLGVKWVVLILPLFFVGTALALLFPLELSMVGGLLVGTGALNYSLNKTSKELLYTEADDETRFRFKPLIDGPLVRFGDVSAALLTLLITRVLQVSSKFEDAIVLGVGLLVCCIWVYSAYCSGVLYASRKSLSSEDVEAF